MPKSPLQEQPRDRVAAVIPSKHESSILDWLQSSGRLVARDRQEPDLQASGEPISDLTDIIDPDDPTYEDFEDSDDPIDDDDIG